MADVIRKVTVEKGFDPRDFVLFAFGGAGPAHAGVFARELGVKQGHRAAAQGRFDLVRVRRGGGGRAAHLRAHRDHADAGAPPSASTTFWMPCRSRPQSAWQSEGIAAGRQRFEFSLDVRHKGQINEVEVLLPFDTLAVADYEPRLRKLFVAAL